MTEAETKKAEQVLERMETVVDLMDSALERIRQVAAELREIKRLNDA